MKNFIKFIELTFRIYMNGFYSRMANYHLRQSEKYISDDKQIKRWKRHTKKSCDYNLKFWVKQVKIEELKTYFKEQYRELA